MQKKLDFSGAFTDIDRTFLSEHAALGVESQQVRISVFFFEKLCNAYLIQRRLPPARYSAALNRHQEDLARQNLGYQQELANLRARVR